MEPKYLLVFEPNIGIGRYPYAIYEQAHVGGQTGQRLHTRYEELIDALKELSKLNDNQPVLLAYSTKPIDNTFSV